MPENEKVDIQNLDLERQKLALEQKRLASDEHFKQEDLKQNAERLRLDAERIKLDQRFVNKYLATMLLAFGTVLTVAVSYVQIRVNEANNSAALQLQTQKYFSDTALEYRKELMTFVIQNQANLSSRDEVVRTRYHAILRSAFPEYAEPWLQAFNSGLPKIPELPQPSEPTKRDWKQDLTWSIGDKGPVGCLAQYEDLPECIFGGARSCVMRIAILEATRGNYSQALKLSLITQCLNPDARKAITNAGQQQVGEFLRTQQ